MREDVEMCGEKKREKSELQSDIAPELNLLDTVEPEYQPETVEDWEASS